MYAIADVDYEQISSPAKYLFAYDPNFFKERIQEDGTLQVKLEDLSILLEILEDEEDVSEGLKALADEEGTVTWEQYQQRRKE